MSMIEYSIIQYDIIFNIMEAPTTGSFWQPSAGPSRLRQRQPRGPPASGAPSNPRHYLDPEVRKTLARDI